MKNFTKKKMSDDGVEMPGSLTELKPILDEFMSKWKAFEMEEEELRLSKKDLLDEYSRKLDTKTLKLAMRYVALKEKVDHKNTFDMFVEALERDE